MWIAIATLSSIINLLCFTYIRWLLVNYKNLMNNSQDTSMELEKYVVHIKAIHELEMFYGDETLKGLIDHGNELIGSLTDIDFIFEQEEEPEELYDQNN